MVRNWVGVVVSRLVVSSISVGAAVLVVAFEIDETVPVPSVVSYHKSHTCRSSIPALAYQYQYTKYLDGVVDTGANTGWVDPPDTVVDVAHWDGKLFQVSIFLINGRTGAFPILDGQCAGQGIEKEISRVPAVQTTKGFAHAGIVTENVS